MNTQQPAVGIDLGTTYSVVAYIDTTGRPVTIHNEAGDLIIPSAVFVDEDDIIVGKEAVKASVLKPEAYAECFKRDMGGVAFRRKVAGQKVPPEILAAFVLERLKRDAERRLGPFCKAVVTVPAFFDEGRRRMTQEAGRLAGLEVLDIINEPTAAAVAYGREHEFVDRAETDAGGKPWRLLVYDLGGGTFDVTILEIEGGRFKTLATDGDVRLGGRDFDERLIEHLARQFHDAHGTDPRSDPQDAAQLWLDAQEMKHALSERTKATTVCFHAGVRMRIEVSRSEFEEMTADLVERTETTSSLVIRQAGLQWNQIDRVLLVGGATRMPMIRDILRQLTGKEPEYSDCPDELVAHGAALYAGTLLAQDADTKNPSCELVNVNSHSLGVIGILKQTGEKTNVVLIPKNTRLPARASRVFRTAKPSQRSIRVSVVEGESSRPEECIALGECAVRDLPAGLAAGTKVEVEYRYAANGRISVVARVPSVRHSAHVEIERDRAPNLDDLKAWRVRLLGRYESQAFDLAAHNQTVNLSDRGSVVRRLDMLYAKVGSVAQRLQVPNSLLASQRMARTAAAELCQAMEALERGQERTEVSLHDAAAFGQQAELARAKSGVDQTRVRADFTCIVFGRECVEREFFPAGLETQLQEIRQLRQHLDRPH